MTNYSNANIDALAAAVPAPYGPLTRVTDMATLPTPNGDRFITLTTDTLNVPVRLRAYELADAEAVQKAIAEAERADYVIHQTIVQIDAANTAIQALKIADGGGYPLGTLETINQLLKDALYVPLSGFAWPRNN